jgi:RNA polymerase subunit RPABC4/transcription elongation factor Spt4
MTLDIIPPGPTSLFIIISPDRIIDFPAGGMLVIRGWVKYNTAQGAPAANVRVFVEDPVNAQTYQVQADGLGVFEFPARVGPSFYGQYDYFLTAKDEDMDIETAESFKLTIVAVEPPKEEEESNNILLYSIIIIVIVVAAVAGTLGYWAFSSRGRMVECGECGTLVPESATQCPKCDIEFEVEVAKCSVCESWIKSDAHVCPYCNTPFSDLDGIGDEGKDGEVPDGEEEDTGDDVIAEVPEGNGALSETFDGSEEGSEVAIKQVPEGLRKEVRPRPVVQKRAVKEVTSDLENGNHANGGENEVLKPRVVKKIPAHSVELQEEVVLDEKEVDLYSLEDEEES